MRVTDLAVRSLNLVARSVTSTEALSTSSAAKPCVISTLETGRPTKFRRRKEGSKEASDTKFNNVGFNSVSNRAKQQTDLIGSKLN